MNKTIIAFVVLAVVLVGGYFVMSMKQEPSQVNNTQQQNQNNQNQQPIVVPKTHDVGYTDTGFMPKELTVKVGDTVRWTNNNSTQMMWVGSAMHPDHIVYGGTPLAQHCPDADNNDFDQCENGQKGESWSFTFTKEGAWGYHNHSFNKDFGKITVQP